MTKIASRKPTAAEEAELRQIVAKWGRDALNKEFLHLFCHTSKGEYPLTCGLTPKRYLDLVSQVYCKAQAEKAPPAQPSRQQAA
jgi:hypothetical protein